MNHQTQQDLHQILQEMKQAHLRSEPASVALRRDRLMRSAALLRENYQAISQAISDDFGHRSGYHSMVADLATTINMLNYSASHVEHWMQSEAA